MYLLKNDKLYVEQVGVFLKVVIQVVDFWGV